VCNTDDRRWRPPENDTDSDFQFHCGWCLSTPGSNARSVRARAPWRARATRRAGRLDRRRGGKL